MFGAHITRHLSEYVHGELSTAERVRVETHLAACSKCRAAYEEIRFGARLASTLTLTPSPAVGAVYDRPGAHRAPLQWVVAIGAIAAIILAILFTRTPTGPAWEVTGLPGTAQLRPGQVLQTGASSQAQIKMANIGELKVNPNSRI